MPTFSARLNAHIIEKQSRVCLGIDPRPHAANLTHNDPSSITDYFRAIIEAAAPHIVAIKPQIAFFEALGKVGLISLDRIIAAARDTGVSVVMDAKRGDIGSTAEAYAEAFLTPDARFHSDALTVNPYLGMDTLEPFIEACEEHTRGIFVLVRTSNPGSALLQDQRLENGRTVAEEVAYHLAVRAKSLAADTHGYTSVGAVIGATHPELIATFRSLLPQAIFLIPGVGAQGGSAAELTPAFDANGLGALINASRSLTYTAAQCSAKTFTEVGVLAKEAAATLQAELNEAIT